MRVMAVAVRVMAVQVVNAGAQGRHRSHKSHWGECSPFNPYHMTLTYDNPHVTVTPREGEKKFAHALHFSLNSVAPVIW